MITRAFLIVATALALAGCEQVNNKLGLVDPAVKEAKTEAEAQAVGSACRHSGRAIEDCYAIYAWLPKAGVYAGWRQMDEYMRENKIETIVPQLPPVEPPGARKRRPSLTAEAANESSSATPPATEESKPAAAEAPAKGK
ncbi:MAG: hypothetical protein CVU34_06375 [Betaproteobacteria bacterium HGW-Betaproteobacteria-7]|jgi:hypothetical protein|nr:MAG: hypothetical protein CVU34_06375 [Betaproteobacteria bacterium HGW-Betaproteobacteria-7]